MSAISANYYSIGQTKGGEVMPPTKKQPSAKIGQKKRKITAVDLANNRIDDVAFDLLQVKLLLAVDIKGVKKVGDNPTEFVMRAKIIDEIIDRLKKLESNPSIESRDKRIDHIEDQLCQYAKRSETEDRNLQQQIEPINSAIGELCEKLKKANERIDEHIELRLDKYAALMDVIASLKAEIANLKQTYGIYRTVNEINQSQTDRRIATPVHEGRLTIIAREPK